MTDTITPTASTTPAAEPKRFADYLATIEPAGTIKHRGREVYIYDVNPDAWADWVDPHYTIEVFEDLAQLADYVPSWSLWYAVDPQDATRWGSGLTAGEAAEEAMTAEPGHIGRAPSAFPCDECGAQAGEGCRPWCTARPE